MIAFSAHLRSVAAAPVELSSYVSADRSFLLRISFCESSRRWYYTWKSFLVTTSFSSFFFL